MASTILAEAPAGGFILDLTAPGTARVSGLAEALAHWLP